MGKQLEEMPSKEDIRMHNKYEKLLTIISP